MPETPHFNQQFFTPKKSEDHAALIDELKKANADLRNARRAALNLMEDAILSKEALAKSEEKYRTLFETIDEGFCLIEMIAVNEGKYVDFRYLEVNEVWGRLTGLGNVVGKLGSEVIPGTENYWLETFAKVAQTGESQRFENYHDDTRRWYSAHISRVGGADSHRVAIVFDDITNKKRREQQQEYLIKLNDALRALSDPLQIQQAAMRVIGEQFGADRVLYSTITQDGEMWVTQDNYTSGRLPKLVGSFPTAAFGASVEPLSRGEVVVYPDVDKATHLSKAEKQLYEEFDTRAALGVPLFKDNRWIANIGIHHREPYEWRKEEIELVRETAERTWAAVERAKAEEALRQSEEKYRTLFNSMEEGVSTLDVIFDTEGKAVDCIHLEHNPSLTKQTGLTSEIMGKRVSEVYGEIEPYWMEAFGRVATTGQPERHEYYLAPLDRWFDVYVSKTGGEGSNNIILVYNNITERKRREQQQEFLLRFSDTLRTLPRKKEIENTGLQLLAEFLGLDRSFIATVYRLEDRAVIGPEYRRPGLGLAAISATHHMSDFPEGFRQVEEQTLVVENIATDAILTDLDRQSLGAINLTALVVASVRKGDRNVIWSLVASTTTPRKWTSDEVQLIEAVAERTWAAVERVRAEEALRQSQKRFHSISNLVPDLLWQSEPDGSTNWYNQRWLEYTGQSLEQASGWGWVETIHPDDREGSAKRYRQAVADGKPFQQEHRIRRYDGEYRWFTVSAVPLKDASGNVVKTYGAATDIHDLKTVQEALLQSEARLRVTLESATDYAIITMNTERKVERWSKGAEELFGYTEVEMIGRSADLIFTEEDRQAGVPQQEMETARDTGRAADDRWHGARTAAAFM